MTRVVVVQLLVHVFHHLVKIARDGPLELGSLLVQRPEAGLEGDCVLLLAAVVRQSLRFLLLLEAAEVVLDQERGIELAYRYLIFH